VREHRIAEKIFSGRLCDSQEEKSSGCPLSKSGNRANLSAQAQNGLIVNFFIFYIMKKIYFIGIAAVAMVAVVVINMSISTYTPSVQNELTLRTVEAHAGLISEIQDWWNSKVYKCTSVSCSAICQQTVTNSVSGSTGWSGTSVSYTNTVSTTYCPGHKQKCEAGSEVAHCSSCNTSCVVDN
jgi:hypothetical protein